MSPADFATERELATERTLAFTRAQVLAAFADPKRLARWWGPAGFTNEFDTCDPRPGGDWLFTMVGPDGARYANQNRFVEVGPERVVIQHVNHPPFVLTVILEPDEGGTRVYWRQSFASEELRKALEGVCIPANEQNLDRLTVELGRG
jgi:hypothetical protein